MDLKNKIMKIMKTYNEVLEIVSSQQVQKGFHDLMGGGYGQTGGISAEVNLLNIIYDVPKKEIEEELRALIKMKEKDLRKHWKEATSGKYKF